MDSRIPVKSSKRLRIWLASGRALQQRLDVVADQAINHLVSPCVPESTPAG